VPRFPKVPSAGFDYPLDGVSSSALESLFQLPTLLGFTLQSFSPVLRPTRGFPRTIHPGAFVPTPSAWHRRSGGFRSHNQPCFPLSPAIADGVEPLLSWVFHLPGFLPPGPRRSVSLPRTPHALDLPASEETGKRSLRGITPTARHFPPFEGRRPAWRFNRLHPPLLWNVNRPRPIFSARAFPDPHEPRKAPLCGRSHPA
jgi:hypothetical protein